MSVRLQIFHNEKIAGTTVEYRMDLDDSEYGGVSQTKVAAEKFFKWEYDKLDERKPFENPIQKSSFIADFLVQEQADLDLLTDILGSDEERFQINFYVDSVHKWSGKVLTDLLEYDEFAFPFVSNIRAKDLSSLDGKSAPSPDTTVNRRLSVLIADCLKETGLTLPIRSFTNLTNSDSGITQANDFLYEIHHRRDAFELDDSMMTCMAVLENICRAYNLIIRQSDARWIVEQLPAVAKGDDTQFDYDSDGLNPTSSTPNRTQTIDGTDSYILRTSKNIVTGALKTVESVYNHRTLIHNITTEDVTYTFNPAPTFKDFSLAFENEPIFRMYFSTDVEVDADTTSGIEGSAYLTVRGVTSDGFSDQYLTDAGSWSAVQQDIEITMSGANGSMSGSFTAKDSGGIADAVEEILITLKWADASLVGGSSQTVTEVRWRNTEVYIFNTLIQDRLASIRSRYTRDGNYSVTEQVGTTVLGDGPIEGNNQASKGRPASGSLASTVIEPGKFRIRGASENILLERITLRERVNMRRSALRNLRADMWINYSPENLISYKSNTWFFSGGHFSAKQSRWTANIIQLSYDGNIAGDIFDGFVEQGGEPSGSLSVTQFIAPLPEARFGGNEALRKKVSRVLRDISIGVITEDLDGVYTSIPVNLFTRARKGFDYDIIHEFTFDEFPITPTSSAGPGKDFLFIEEQFIKAPAGSYIMKNPTQQEAEQTDNPSFEFVGDTLQVINGELKATMDLIAEGEVYGRVHKDSINELGEIIFHEFEGTLDDLKDGEFYARVRKSSLTDTGLVFVDALIGTLDDLDDGVDWKRVSSSALDANGLVILNAVQGDLDDIADGATHGKVDRAALDANGLIIISALVGDFDDLDDGTTYKKVLATNISAGNIKILGPDGQTVIDQGTIDTDAIFASEATITKKLTMGTGGIISNAANDFLINPSGIEVKTTDSFLGAERTLGVEGRGGLWGVTTGASLNLSSATGIPIDIQAGTASGNALLRFVSDRSEFGSRMKLVNLTETERDDLTGNEAGDVIYNTTTDRPNYHNGTGWVNF